MKLSEISRTTDHEDLPTVDQMYTISDTFKTSTAPIGEYIDACNA